MWRYRPADGPFGDGEAGRRVAKERNALLSQSLRAPLEKGIIALENGNIQIQASFLFPRNGADLTSEGVNIIKSIGKGLQDVLDTGDAIYCLPYG